MLALSLLSLGLLAGVAFLVTGAAWPPIVVFAAGLLTGAFLVAAGWALARSEGLGSGEARDAERISRHPHPYERGRWSY